MFDHELRLFGRDVSNDSRQHDCFLGLHIVGNKRTSHNRSQDFELLSLCGLQESKDGFIEQFVLSVREIPKCLPLLLQFARHLGQMRFNAPAETLTGKRV